MRTLSTDCIPEAVAKLVGDACIYLGNDTIAALQTAREKEESPYGRDVLDVLLQNAACAREEGMPLCQDTGTAILFCDVGQELCLTGAPFEEMINRGVALGYERYYLRKSIVGDPFTRINTKNNTPAVIHTRLVPGDKLTITAMPKGGGCENMGKFTTLLPGQGKQGVIDFVLACVKEAQGSPCPPVILGIGIGGSMEKTCLLSKQALLRKVGQRHEDPAYAALEEEILQKVNDLGMGPMGLGGTTYALDCHIAVTGCHITALPVAVSFQCHANRHATITL